MEKQSYTRQLSKPSHKERASGTTSMLTAALLAVFSPPDNILEILNDSPR